MRRRSETIAAIIVRTVISYGVSFISIPAIILQGFGIVLAILSLYSLLTLWLPGETQFVLGTALNIVHVENFSYRGSLVQPILVTFTALTFATKLIWPLIRWKFRVHWEWTGLRLLGALTALSAGTSGMFMLSLLCIHSTLMPALLVFGCTFVASLVAVLGYEIERRIVGVVSWV